MFVNLKTGTKKKCSKKKLDYVSDDANHSSLNNQLDRGEEAILSLNKHENLYFDNLNKIFI